MQPITANDCEYSNCYEQNLNEQDIKMSINGTSMISGLVSMVIEM
jgi:hypothetical protein